MLARTTRLSIVGLVLCWVAPAAAAPTWTFQGKVVEGGQLDAVRGPNDRIHIVSSRYYQLDASGTVLVDEAQGDGWQGSLDFPPAIAVGADGSVHIVTRHGGSFANGHNIRYRRRHPQGNWDRDYLFGTPVKRNYVVGVSWSEGPHVHLGSSHCGTQIWGDIHLFEAGQSSATPIGDLTGIWRADADYRMRGLANRVMLVSGVCDPSGTVFFGCGSAGGTLATEITASLHSHTEGTGRRAFPDVYVDHVGGVHMTYGGANQVYYARHDSEGNELLNGDRLVFDGLGGWSLQTGLSAVAASDGGNVVVAVALDGDNSELAADSNLLWAYSTNGGDTWSIPADLGKNTHGGAGRRRPRLVAIGNAFRLLYWDNGLSGIAMASVLIEVDDDEDGYPAGLDCDDTDDSVFPGAAELCNGVDDNCDGEIDEGCGAPDGGSGAGPGEGGNPGTGGTPTSSSDGGQGGDNASNGGLYGACHCTAAGRPSPGGVGYWLVTAVALGLRQRRRPTSACPRGVID